MSGLRDPHKTHKVEVSSLEGRYSLRKHKVSNHQMWIQYPLPIQNTVLQDFCVKIYSSFLKYYFHCKVQCYKCLQKYSFQKEQNLLGILVLRGRQTLPICAYDKKSKTKTKWKAHPDNYSVTLCLKFTSRIFNSYSFYAFPESGLQYCK